MISDLKQIKTTLANEMQSKSKVRCGFAAIVGRPNVGKSTLLNHLLGQKLCITSRKPQTTRHTLLGIKTQQGVQTIYVDTPGIHKSEKKAINRYMNKVATSAIDGIDVVIFMVDRMVWTAEDELVFNKILEVTCPVILAVNKMDRVKKKDLLFDHLKVLSEKMNFKSVIPVSARYSHNLDELDSEIVKLMPENPHYFPEDQFTDRSSRFLAAELVREKVMRQLGDELPYEVTVEIEEFKQEMTFNRSLATIRALIWVERAAQKAIVIGNRGSRLKKIGQESRLDMERLFDSKVMLHLWVKVKNGWSNDEYALKSLGYDYC